jgi:hypothetical protein
MPQHSQAQSPFGKNRVAKPPAVQPAAPVVETVRPSFARLSAILAVCFSAGFGWPLLGDVGFVQRPPGSKPLDATETEASPNAAGDVARATSIANAKAAPLATTRQAVQIESRIVQSCEGDGGEVVARCDDPDLSGVIEPSIAKLAACDEAEGLSGVLSLGMNLDFSRRRITRVKVGQSSTLAERDAAKILTCAEDSVVGTALDDVEHEHARYWVYYLVRFLPPGSPMDSASAPPSEEVVKASGQATIGWRTAIVRDAPSPSANVAGRLSFGTRVSVTGRAGEWYRIERGGKSLGWIHRKGIGM